MGGGRGRAGPSGLRNLLRLKASVSPQHPKDEHPFPLGGGEKRVREATPTYKYDSPQLAARMLHFLVPTIITSAG